MMRMILNDGKDVLQWVLSELGSRIGVRDKLEGLQGLRDFGCLECFFDAGYEPPASHCARRVPLLRSKRGRDGRGHAPRTRFACARPFRWAKGAGLTLPRLNKRAAVDGVVATLVFGVSFGAVLGDYGVVGWVVFAGGEVFAV